jgi:hypothetical protein
LVHKKNALRSLYSVMGTKIQIGVENAVLGALTLPLRRSPNPAGLLGGNTSEEGREKKGQGG